MLAKYFGLIALFASVGDLPADAAESNEHSSVTRPDYNYPYSSATDLDDYFTIMYYPLSKKIASSLRKDIAVDIKLADENDPSIQLYMHFGPIRFYLPTAEIKTLPQSGWRYKECEYRIVDVQGTHYFNRETKELGKETMWTVIIEAVCDDPTYPAARYHYAEYGGLYAITLGEMSESGFGQSTFKPRKTYFLKSRLDGFGGRINEPY